MKASVRHQISPTIGLAAMLATFAPGVALADNFVGTDFHTVAAAAGSAPEFDFAAHGYRKLNLSVIGNIAWVPSDRGVQGPLRAHDGPVMDQEIDRRFYPIGGHNTP